MTDLLTASSPRADYRPTLAFSTIIAGYAAFNASMLWAMYRQRDDNEYLLSFAVGAWVFQSMSFGIWLAMGSGKFVMRLPFILVGLLIVCSLMGVASSSLEKLERIDFIALVVGACVIFCLAFVAFSIVRWFTRRRIVQADAPHGADRGKVRFNVRYLLTLTTALAIGLGAVSQLKFINPQPQQFLGPEFVFYIIIVGGAIVSGVVLPATVVPFFVLQGHASKHAQKYAIGFWFAVTLFTLLIWELNDPQPLPEVVPPVLLVQFGAALAGLLAAIPLRLAGFHLEQNRDHRADSVAHVFTN